MHWKVEEASEGGGGVGSRSRVRDGKAWRKGVPLTLLVVIKYLHYSPCFQGPLALSHPSQQPWPIGCLTKCSDGATSACQSNMLHPCGPLALFHPLGNYLLVASQNAPMEQQVHGEVTCFTFADLWSRWPNGPMYHIPVDHDLVPIINLGDNVPLFTIHWVVVALLMWASLYPWYSFLVLMALLTPASLYLLYPSMVPKTLLTRVLRHLWTHGPWAISPWNYFLFLNCPCGWYPLGY